MILRSIKCRQGAGAQEAPGSRRGRLASEEGRGGPGVSESRLRPGRSGQDEACRLLGRRGSLTLAPTNTGSLEVLAFEAFRFSAKGKGAAVAVTPHTSRPPPQGGVWPSSRGMSERNPYSFPVAAIAEYSKVAP